MPNSSRAAQDRPEAIRKTLWRLRNNTENLSQNEINSAQVRADIPATSARISKKIAQKGANPIRFPRYAHFHRCCCCDIKELRSRSRFGDRVIQGTSSLPGAERTQRQRRLQGRDS